MLCNKWTTVLALALIFCLFDINSTAKAQQRKATVILAGYKVKPPVSTPATGTVTVTIRKDSLFVEGSFSDLNSTYRGSAIHYGSKNENGNQVLKLSSTLDENQRGGKFLRKENGFKLTEMLKQYLDQGLMYIGIYSNLRPRGELRGQIPGKEKSN